MPLTPLNESSSAVTRSSAHNAPSRDQPVLPAKKGAQGMIVKHKLPCTHQESEAVTLGLFPAARNQMQRPGLWPMVRPETSRVSRFPTQAPST
jgi:hypothetical protein